MSLPQCPTSPTSQQLPCEALTENAYNLEDNLTYRITMPISFSYTDGTGTHIMQFNVWADGPTLNVRDIPLTADLTLTANYVELQTYTVSGIVTNVANGTVIIAALMTFVSTIFTDQTLTDVNGSYQILVPPDTYQVTVEKQGFETSVLTPVVVAGDMTLNVTLVPSPIQDSTLPILAIGAALSLITAEPLPLIAAAAYVYFTRR